ncbi:MAG: AMIN domain-containing protein [Coleofasciculus chthonoplastes F3-SA18-01]|uniref:AMIN domain-containing protein n=1 Tax=Coleofasciculus chthonoplastes TaxID=64178 RepID=UPI0032FD1A90
MRQEQLFSGIAIATAVSLSITQPVWAATAEVTAVRLNPRGSSLELILETQAGDQRPQVFPVNRGKDWVADIVNARLNLREGNSFRQDNPMPGITAVTVSQIEPNSIRVTVSGAESPPEGQILQQASQAITLGISPAPSNQAAVSIPISSPSGESASITPPTLPSSTASNSARSRENVSIPQLGSSSAGTRTEASNAALNPIAAQPEITTPANFNLNPAVENQQNISIPVTPPPRESGSTVATLPNLGTTRSTSDFSSPATPRSQSQRSNSPPVVAQTPTPDSPEPTQAQPTPVVPAPSPDVLVPNPTITIDGVPAAPAGAVQPVAPAPPFLPRAVAPPVGDIAVSNLNAAASEIDLGTAAVVPRLSLREAPVREVLALLARSAGLNLAFTGAGGEGEAAQETISLDLENEPVQDVFNYVLQLSGLQANRRGRTIFVGARLPQAARNLISRTLRLNQVSAASASAFLSAQGAETQRVVETVQLETIGEGGAARTVESRQTNIEPLSATEGEGPLLLRGLSVITDERLNAVTLVGEPQKIELASALLTQLDLRRRQVAINVKIIDVNLLGTDAFNSSFSFGVGDGFFAVDSGAAIYNFSSTSPPTVSQTRNSVFGPPVINFPAPDGANLTPFFDRAGDDAPFDNFDSDSNVPFARPNFGRFNNPFQPGVTDITPGEVQFDIVPIEIDPDTGQPTRFAIQPNFTPTEFEFELPGLFQFPSQFLARLDAQITSGNAKILTDPTLVVQEGQSARVQLTQEVFGGTELVTRAVGQDSFTVEQPIIRDAGLILDVRVDRIDDNGFITLGIDPTVSSVSASQDTPVGVITLTQERTLQSGAIRLRDGQTLILAGIIQESDQTSVSKVPILGDIPLLGALFRSTSRQNSRQEVIVLLTPQILDDSERGAFGYNYTPGREAQEVLQRRGFPTTGGF